MFLIKQCVYLGLHIKKEAHIMIMHNHIIRSFSGHSSQSVEGHCVFWIVDFWNMVCFGGGNRSRYYGKPD